MNSLDPSCNELKAKYDACFNVWFAEKFLRGSRDASDDAMCKPLFLVYRDCVRKAMQEHKINLAEVDKAILGTNEEKQAPEQQQDGQAKSPEQKQ